MCGALVGVAAVRANVMVQMLDSPAWPKSRQERLSTRPKAFKRALRAVLDPSRAPEPSKTRPRLAKSAEEAARRSPKTVPGGVQRAVLELVGHQPAKWPQEASRGPF